MSKLHNAPSAVFDFWMECEGEGFLPSVDDFHEKFGDEYEEWKHIFFDTRQELWGEVADDQFITMEDLMKEAGHKQNDFE